MTSRILLLSTLLALLAGISPALSAPKPAAVIYFNDGSAAAGEQASMIEDILREMIGNFSPPVQTYALDKESNLAAAVEKIADGNVGLILIIEPHDTQALAKIPGLYPDISFTVIGAPSAFYFSNVRSIQFKEQEGTFMMGVLAALQSKSGAVAFAAAEDSPYSRNLAYGFLQGAKHANPEVKVSQKLGGAPQLPADDSDIIFVLDEAFLDNALRQAREQKRLLITYNHTLTKAHPGVVLTSLFKHYDLAIHRALRDYARDAWKPGSQTMGIGNSYIDYVLDSGNRSLLPKETIDQIEMTKDFVSQGIIPVNPLVQ